MSLCQFSPDLDFWSDVSDVGWGAHLGQQVASGLWTSPQASVHQCQGIACHPTRSPPLSVVSTRSYGGSLLRQRHGSSVSLQRGRNQVSCAQLLSPGDPEVGGVPRHSSGSTVHPRLQQRPGGRSISPSPAPLFRVVPQHDRLSIFVSSVAGPNRFICDLFFFFLYEWEHRTGTMCPFSSLHPLKKGKEV